LVDNKNGRTHFSTDLKTGQNRRNFFPVQQLWTKYAKSKRNSLRDLERQNKKTKVEFGNSCTTSSLESK
jgi:hypothetical protein